jgi:antitoxin component YwqK of YwqJK toxin-antitoxin module
MKKLVPVIYLFFLVSCGQTQDEMNNIALVTCSIISETRNMDAAIRVREMNNAREKIGGEPFLEGDYKISESLRYGLCRELVLDDAYDQSLKILKDAERERQKLATEKVRIANTKPSVKEEFYPNGQLKRRENRQPQNDGGKLHGLRESFYDNGQLERKAYWKDGKLEGLRVDYQKNGQLESKINYKNGKLHGLYERYEVSTGKLKSITNYKEGESDGLFQIYLKNGELQGELCYRNSELSGMSYCKN